MKPKRIRSCRVCRRFSEKELELLAALWPTSLPDKRLEAIFKRHTGAINRAARETLHLPTRAVARSIASAEYEAKIVEFILWRDAA